MADTTNFDWIVPFGRGAIQNEAVNDAQNKASAGKSLTREEDSGTGRFWMTFDSGGGDIFTAKNVQTMCEVEQLILTSDRYKQFCVIKDEAGVCTEPTLTIAYAFYGTVNDTSCPLLPEANVTTRAQELYNGLQIPSERSYSSFFMDGGTESRSPVFTQLTRSRIDLGAPLKGYLSPFDEESEQLQDYVDYYEDVKQIYFDAFGMKSVWLYSAYRDKQSRNGLECKWYSSPLVNIENADISGGDITLAIFSLIFVYLWMLFQMKSFFLSTFCMLQVLFSLPVAIVVYRSVFQIPYFQFIHILVIFLVLGVGADDVFVMYDGWRFSAQAVEIKELEKQKVSEEVLLEKRMEIAFTSTIGAIWTTSFTTIVSFLATAISPIMPIATFGILAATAILLNFLLVISLIPAILVTYHFWFVKGRFCQLHEHEYDIVQDEENAIVSDGFKEKEKEKKEAKFDDKITGKGDVELKNGKEPHRGSVASIGAAQHQESKVNDEDTKEKKDFLQVFIEKAYLPMMTKKMGYFYPFAIGWVATLLILAIVAAAYTAQLQPPDDAAQFLPEDNMLVLVPSQLSDDFIPGEFTQFTELRYPFGIDTLDRGDFSIYEPGKDRGDVKFDSTFDLFPAASQEAFNHACDLAQTKTCGSNGCEGGFLQSQIDGAQKCFLPAFQAWFATRHPGNTTLNCTRELFLSGLKEYRETDTESVDGLSLSDKVFLIGFVEDELKYVRFQFYSTIKNDISTLKKQDARKTADDLADEINSYSNSVGANLGSTFSASSTWVGVEAELGIVSGFYSGLAVCFPVAFCVLLFSTHNIIVSLLAISTIGFIVLCVLATIVWDGDALGIAEAIAGVIVIGFSVDYVIHLGHTFIDAYHTFGIEPRAERFNHAAIGMAGTVIAGGVTTFGAALPLLGTQQQFFPTMGALMASTVAFSLTFSLLFFMGSLLLIGPNGAVGDLSWIAEKIGLAPYLKKWGLMSEEKHKPKRKKNLEEKTSGYEEKSAGAAKVPASSVKDANADKIQVEGQSVKSTTLCWCHVNGGANLHGL
eukprot:CAMPEP_0167740656 /NCGR_PEP_ID=MMETSP0110_2-20121227/407_1 /TAXON_ID=629695 /ORGANISM="Gymnochlora sp., Strain CCMP2014" /LENGTH=1038 /DNA_ID=CAMNT_0007624591 /DNA_START=145 /DNA_END=3262 /DNA_ORIENTATION=+